ncbi:hypothetical protein K493DRAFT_337834 [Basidiobolus meristosporus CBS 931.73]|uniref:WD40 repeat-like protein n=1 Tax=Basidiobolus meristosporus CBS 931.73 TaxID=1314790 RepID=A0A1Y1Y8R7_9FUNG|nr:hypothetical protein K493DRAFT_337834 [Basidiobolus meristosporus CBS 931.73]|eukprot:ORX94393.1 hypothetical protein K493DRAFT_337834 [Basidiobolus meristosporus CBS 931.73]
MSPNLSHGIAYQALHSEGLTWRRMFQNNWELLRSWNEYIPNPLLYQLPFCSSRFGPQWRHMVQSNVQKEFRYVSRRLVEDHFGGLIGYGGCVEKEQYNVIIWSKNNWKCQGHYGIPIDGEERVELIAVNSQRRVFVVAYGNDPRGIEWNRIQLYRMDSANDVALQSEFRTQTQATFYCGNFDVPFGGESNPRAFTLFAIESSRNSMVVLNFDFVSGQLISKRSYNSDVQMLNYYPAKGRHLVFGTTYNGDVYIWDLLGGDSWRVMANGALCPWGTELAIIFSRAIDRHAIKMITTGDNGIDKNFVILWELQQRIENGQLVQQAHLLYQVEIQSREGIFGSYCVHGSCFLGLTYDGTIMVYHLEDLRKLASIPIPTKYEFYKHLSPEEMYDISVNDVGQIVLSTSRGLYVLPTPVSEFVGPTMFMHS